MTRLIDRLTRRHADVIVLSPTPDLKDAGRRDALELTHAVHRGAIVYSTMKSKWRGFPPKNMVQLFSAMGNMAFTHEGSLDEVFIRYAVDSSKDVTIHEHADPRTTLAYVMGFLAYKNHLHRVDPENNPLFWEAGAFRLKDMQNDYTEAYATVLLEEFTERL